MSGAIPSLPMASRLAIGTLLLAIGAGWLLNPAPGRPVAADSEGGFVNELVLGGLSSPIDFAFAPDGRIFLASKSGDVWIIQDGALLPDPFITLPVNTYWDRGLQSIVLDPNFATNSYVYLYYTYENNPADFQGPKTGQLIRVTADGDVASPGSALVLLGANVGDADHPSCQDLPPGADCIPADGASHMGGGLAFASDGALLLATGDAAFFGYDIVPELMSRPQDLDSLAGKLLRINPADGTALTDNPFFAGDPEANRSKVWSYGFRNPFRIGIDPTTGLLPVGDVGYRWEEIDIAEPGANFGWPCYEGTAEQPPLNTYVTCQSLYASGIPNAHPLYSYAAPDTAVMAGVFYHGSDYPAEFAGAFFFADWVQNTVSFLPADPDTGQLLPGAAQQLFAGAGAPVDFEAGPNGDMYYLAWSGSGPGQLRHIRFVEGNRPPVTQASATPGGGLAPLSVQLSSAGSSDPDGDAVSFAWDFGDGGTSDEANPMHVYTQDGAYQARLTVSDPAGAVSSAVLSVLVGNQPPVATISAPSPNSPYQGGQTLAFSGSGFDPETGTLAGFRLQWAVQLHHCHAEIHACHAHPFLNKTGTNGTLIAPPQALGNELLFLELQLTATDSAGLSNSVSIFVGPDADEDGLLDHDEVLTYLTDYVNPDTDGDTCEDGPEVGPNERLGGRRDPLNPWDYFNPTGDGKNRVDDILSVIQHYAQDVGEPGYDTKYDRTYLGPDPWNLGPPNGLIRVADILAAVRQFAHDCD